MNCNFISSLNLKTKKTCEGIKVTEINPLYEEKKKNLIFIPGGPGIDSSYMLPLATEIYYQYSYIFNLLLIDLPGNGSNIVEQPNYNIWKKVLKSFLKEKGNPIVISHSFASLFLLSLENIDCLVEKLILISACEPGKIGDPDFSNKNNLPDLTSIAAKYFSCPSDKSFKEMYSSKEYSQYYFAESYRDIGINYLSQTNSQHKAFDWSVREFLPNWKQVNVPSVPTLLISGKKDGATPFSVLEKSDYFKRENIVITGIDNAGHFPWIEQKKEVCNEISLFLF